MLLTKAKENVPNFLLITWCQRIEQEERIGDGFGTAQLTQT